MRQRAEKFSLQEKMLDIVVKGKRGCEFRHFFFFTLSLDH